MKIANKLFSYLSLFLILLAPLSAGHDYQIENQPIAYEQAVNFSSQGILKQKANGFVYLDVSNEFINQLVPLLDIPGELRPRPTASKSLGAHISVFNEKENIIPSELTQSFSFYVENIRSFTMHTRDGLKKLWVIAVQSPELEALRMQYGLTPKLKGHDFHITLGKQMPTAPLNWESIEVLSPYNFSDEPVEDLSTNDNFVTVQMSDVIEIAQRVDAIGQLKLKSNGFVYADVSNDYVDKITPFLPITSEFNPTSTKVKKMGAHISVMYEDEMIGNEIWCLHEAGEWFTFEVKELRYFDRKTPNGVKRYWLLACDSPALQRLRMNYGLKPKLQNHDFHITLGTEQLEAKKEAA